MEASRIPLFVVEDQAPVLKGCVKLLATFPEVEVVGTAMSGEAALYRAAGERRARRAHGHRAAGMDGLSLVGELKAAQVACELLVLTSFVDDTEGVRGDAARRGRVSGERRPGANGCARRSTRWTTGGTVIEPRLAKTFWHYFKGVEAPPHDEPVLTRTNCSCLKLVAKGLSNAEAAQVLGLPRRNVRTRLQKIYDKLGARSHVDAVVVALKRGLIQV